MLLLEINSQSFTIKSDRFKVIMEAKQVRIVDVNTKETTIIDAKVLKVPGSPDTLPFEWLPDTFDKAFKEDLIENNKMGLEKMQVAGSLASWVKKGMLINNKDGTYTKTKSL